MIEQLGILLVADFSHMNFTQMHERLRLELLRRIQRGSLSVSLLARQTGFGQSHISNFLRGRRQLSLEALDRVLFAQQITPWDLLPLDLRLAKAREPEETEIVPIISHTAALFEPVIRASSRNMLHVPPGWLGATRSSHSASRKSWRRFVAISIPAGDAQAMDPLIQADAIVVLDRHYHSLARYRPNRDNIYAVRNGNRLSLRYVDFIANRLVLRPHNLAFPVDLLQIAPGETVGDLIAGRIALIINEL